MSGVIYTEEWLLERCTEDAGCLLWNGQTNRNGSPITRTPVSEGKRHTKQVRRIVWEMRNGPIPKGKLVTYSCTNPRCLQCLELATPGEVIRRSWERPDIRARRVASITRTSRARGKLNMPKARHIRESDATLEEVADELGISMTLASQVRRGILWREEGNPFAGLM